MPPIVTQNRPFFLSNFRPIKDHMIYGLNLVFHIDIILKTDLILTGFDTTLLKKTQSGHKITKRSTKSVPLGGTAFY